MQFNRSLSTVLSGQFLLEESAVAAFQLQIAQLLTAQSGPVGDRPAKVATPNACVAISADAMSVQLRGYGSLDEVPAGSIAVTLVSGVMLPDDHYDWEAGYVPGTRTLGARIQAADAHANIVGHVGFFVTPGGSVLGVESLGDIIAGTTKPFVAYAEMMCSAGMWAGCAADRVVVAKTGIVGSIGTKWDALDFSAYYERMGIKQVSHTATDSTEKTRAFDEALKGKPALLRSQMLDPLNDVFLATVRAHRPDVDPDALTGKVYVGQMGIDAGLADQVGSLQDAIQLAFDLAEQGPAAGTVGGTSAALPISNSFSPTPNQPTMGLFDKKDKPTAFAAVMALAGHETIATAAADAANAELREAGITSAALITQEAHTVLSEKAGRVDAAEKSVTELTASVTTLTASETQLKADLKASQDEVTRLGALSGANPTTAAKKDGDSQVATLTASYFNPNAQHNKDAEALLG